MPSAHLQLRDLFLPLGRLALDVGPALAALATRRGGAAPGGLAASPGGCLAELRSQVREAGGVRAFETRHPRLAIGFFGFDVR